MKDTTLGRLAGDIREMVREQIEHRELLYRMTVMYLEHCWRHERAALMAETA